MKGEEIVVGPSGTVAACAVSGVVRGGLERRHMNPDGWRRARAAAQTTSRPLRRVYDRCQVPRRDGCSYPAAYLPKKRPR